MVACQNMSSLADTVYVCGHRKPDTDSAVSAFIAAALLADDDPGRRYIPILAGPPIPQTVWLFSEAGAALPPVVEDIRPTAGQCCREAVSVSPSTPLGEALDLLAMKRFGALPVVGGDSRLEGFLSPRKPEAQFLFHLNVEDFLGTILLADDLSGGLDLKPLSQPAGRDLSRARRIQIFQPGLPSGPHDVLLAEGVEAARMAAACHPAGIIVCGPHADEAAREFADCPVPAWHFKGSIMALATSLPRAIPVGRIMSAADACARDSDFLEDLLPVLARLPHPLPVVDADSRLVGMISQRAALAPPRPGIVLVDHFEKSQAVKGLSSAALIEIIDHHRVGTLESDSPVRVDCRPLGSTASILACRLESAGRRPDPSQAKLLLGAIVADTLLLTSPTTTPEDRRLAEKLASIAGVSLESFGRAVLSRNDSLADAPAPELVARDLKEFEAGGLRFLVGQIETVDLGLLPRRRAELADALEAARRSAAADFAVLMITDVAASDSWLLAADPEPGRCERLIGCPDAAQGTLFPGMVSRKKQAIPLLLDRFKTNS